MRTCGILVRRDGKFVTCGLPANFNIVVRGQLLFTICHRHDKRLARAFGK